MLTLKRFITLLTTLLALNANGQTINDSLSYKLDEYFTALTQLGSFNGNVVVSQHGKTLLANSYNIIGVTDSLRINRDSKFIIASISKVFIKFSILKLVEKNKLNLQDKLNRFIPDFPNGEKITIIQLLHHQSGLPRELSNYEAYNNLTLLKTVELAKLEKLQFEPGTQTLYSNVGYFLLHFIIDQESEHGYLKFLQKEVFQRMNLPNTSEFNATETVKNLACGFNRENGSIVPASRESLNKFETGNYLSTIGDLYRFGEQVLNGDGLKKELAIEMFDSDSCLIQAGGRPGYRAYFYINLKTEINFIFLSNYTNMPFQETIADVLSILNGKPYEIPSAVSRKEIAISVETLKRFVGTYALEADISLKISIQLVDGKLYNVGTDGSKAELHPDSEFTFFEEPNTKDGYTFKYNSELKKYDLTITQTGVAFKANRID